VLNAKLIKKKKKRIQINSFWNQLVFFNNKQIINKKILNEQHYLNSSLGRSKNIISFSSFFF
jgi:hypothetical protein